jgi:SAM-dependent methyltransferase
MTSDTKNWWENYSRAYQDDCQIPVDIHYGPSSPNEDELNLLGDLKGRDVLEIGCGGAQCSVAFALRGARVTGLDLSAEQLKFAQALAARHDVEIELVQHDMRDLEPISSASKDIVFSAFALQFVEDRTQTFREVRRVLRPGGVFVFSLDHPFFRKVDPDTLMLVESYNETGPTIDDRGKFGQVMIYRDTIAGLHQALVEAGLTIERIIEPDSRIRYYYDPWFGRRDVYDPKILDMVPPTIIMKSIKSHK